MVTKKFEELFDFAHKSNLKASENVNNGTYLFYTSSNIITKKTDNPQYFDESLIVGNGGYANIHYSKTPFATTSHCFVATAKDSSTNIKFVYYYLLHNIHILERGFVGAGLKNVSKKYISNIEIPIIPIEIQNRIVLLLDKVGQIIHKRNEAIKLIDDLLYATFLEMFGDPISNKKGWNIELLSSIANLERGKFTPRPRNDPSFFDGDYPFIQTGDINNSNYRLKDYTQTLNNRGITVSKQFNAGDIVIAIVGATIGATSILQIDAYATDSVIAIKSKRQTNNIFLEMVLRFYRQLLLDTAPSAARANINLSILGKLKIIVPPIELQNTYRQIDSNIYSNKRKFQESLVELKNLQKTIAQRFFSGQLILDTTAELEAIIKSIDLLDKSNDISSIKEDSTLLKMLIDKLNTRDFSDIEMYDKAKHIAFQLLSEDDFSSLICNKYDEKSSSIKLEIK